MANTFTAITKYLTKAVDTVLAEESKTALLENGSKYINVNFDEAGYVKIFSILMDGLSDYYRVNEGVVANAYSHYSDASGDGYRVGSTTGHWELFKLAYDRGKQFQIDSVSNEEEAGLIIGNLLTEFLRTKVVPEVDTLRLSKIASKCYASLGNLVSATPTATSDSTGPIHLLNDAFAWLSNHEVPSEDQVIFCTPDFMTLIRNTPELNKYILQADYKSEKGITFTLPSYSGRPIIEVPASRLYTGAVAYPDNGFGPEVGVSKVINFEIVSKKCIVPVVKLEKAKIFGPDVVQDFDGYKVNFRIYHDVIIPKNKIIGAYVCYDSTKLAEANYAASLSVALSAGSATGTTVTDGVYTTPAGLYGTLYASKTAFTLQEAKNDDAIEIPQDGTAWTSSLGTSLYFALVSGGKVIAATSAAITIPQGA